MMMRMIAVAAAFVCVKAATMTEHAAGLARMSEEQWNDVYDYATRRKHRVGEWNPGPPPPKEASGHVEPGLPSDAATMRSDFKFSRAFKNGRRQVAPPKHSPSMSFKGVGARKLLQGAEAAKGSKVPHNWFGQGKYTAPIYEIATGKDECDLCKLMLDTGKSIVSNEYYSSEGAEAAELEAMGLNPGQINLCADVDKKFKDMCKGYIKYLIDCPSFVHNICHEDMGGSERLRAPCPDHLKCYYCLRINPLYCLTTDEMRS